MSDAEVQAEMMGVLKTMYPKITVPEPVKITFARWFSDPLYRGSFSNWPPRCARPLISAQLSIVRGLIDDAWTPFAPFFFEP